MEWNIDRRQRRRTRNGVGCVAMGVHPPELTAVRSFSTKAAPAKTSPAGPSDRISAKPAATPEVAQASAFPILRAADVPFGVRDDLVAWMLPELPPDATGFRVQVEVSAQSELAGDGPSAFLALLARVAVRPASGPGGVLLPIQLGQLFDPAAGQPATLVAMARAEFPSRYEGGSRLVLEWTSNVAAFTGLGDVAGVWRVDLKLEPIN